MPSSWTSLRAAAGLAGFCLLLGCGSAPRSTQSNVTDKSAVAKINLEATALNHRQVLEKIFAANSSCAAETPQPSPPQLRRLTRAEYNRSVRSIFQSEIDLERYLPADEAVFGFKNNSSLNFVTVDHAIAYNRAAEKMVAEVVGTRWAQLMPCSIETGASCAEAFLDTYGRRIWRRPLQGEERSTLLKIHATGAEQSAVAGMSLMLRAMLTTPAFLYRSEIGTSGLLDAYEWASALAYFFWAAPPDDILLDRAADGSLMEETTFSREIERLLQHPHAKEGIKAFADSWTGYTQILQVSKDSSRFPAFDSQLRQSLARETEDFFDQVIRAQNGSFSDLMLADYTVGDARLASFYQAPHDASTGRIDLSGQPRRGILGHASILASLAYAGETNPIKRGKFVREHLLCEELLPPPPTLNIQPPPPKEGATTRERFAAHSSLPACKGCHVKLDGAGFGLEDFDAIGRYRSSDNGKAVDASGELFDVDGRNQPFNGGRELTELIGVAQRAERCFALQWFRLAHGRIEKEQDICAIRQLGDEFSQGLSVRELMVKVMTQASYRQRSF